MADRCSWCGGAVLCGRCLEGQAAAVLEAVLAVEEDAAAPLPAPEADDASAVVDEDESPDEEALELMASMVVSFGRCCVDPPEELERLSFL
ncbi:conserved hypothetical protein [Frankia canadensis]|uniref:Uncharacterized protein n=1 Tax=Frankia canadensis TaxID=1836972 RepID=A0A2I2KW72_9ACTN|nr:hypothetical protein [Frankia canadensis]SNQ49927.1 conserved hypothetical protein [Frankia canadensis]SOU57217.1 conserved hypothetical protein [Frankia canadensis]